MRYIKLKNGLPVELRTEYPQELRDNTEQYAKRFTKNGMKVSGLVTNANGWMTDRDCQSFDEAVMLASYVTAMSGTTYLPTDTGPNCSPQFGLMEAPKVGDPVSYSFNGDTYPCGYVTKISPTWQITTSEGKKFRRRGNQPGFSMEGGTWSLVAGHHYDQNPSF